MPTANLSPRVILFPKSAREGAMGVALELTAEDVARLTDYALAIIESGKVPPGQLIVEDTVEMAGEARELPLLNGENGLAGPQFAKADEDDEWDAGSFAGGYDDDYYDYGDPTQQILLAWTNDPQGNLWLVERMSNVVEYPAWDVLSAGLVVGTEEDVHAHIERMRKFPGAFDHVVTPMDRPEAFEAVLSEPDSWADLLNDEERSAFLESSRREVREAAIRSLGQGRSR